MYPAESAACETADTMQLTVTIFVCTYKYCTGMIFNCKTLYIEVHFIYN